MLKFGHSRLMALGDFKRTWRNDKTTCGVFHWSVKNHRTFRSVSMSTKTRDTSSVLLCGRILCSRLMALGDFKRTSRNGKTILIAPPKEALRNPLSWKEEEICQEC